MNLAGKVTIVTGAGNGIGLTLAKRLAAAGSAVAVADLDHAAAARALTEIRKNLPSAQLLAVKVDVADRSSVEAMVEEVITGFGGIDILICNAGVWKNLTRGPFWKLDPKEWELAFRVNTDGAFNCMSAVAPHLIAKGAGRIVVIGSAAIGEALAHLPHYCASKSALTGLVRCAARELGRDGITVNLVHPGQVDTGAFSPEQLEERARQKFVHRVGQPHDLEGIVNLLASEEGGFITAQQIYVDGGGVMN